MTERTPSFPLNSYAFPFTCDDFVCTGMTLRDYFAAKAIMPMTVKLENSELAGYSISSIAEKAYELADAMIKVRNNK